VANVITELLFFSASFACIFYLKSRGFDLPSLYLGNMFINRDEGLHGEFFSTVYREHIVQKLPRETVETMIRNAVEVELKFVDEALKYNLIGMKAVDMREYVLYTANQVFALLGYEGVLYEGAKMNLKFMEQIALKPQTNFFETHNNEYRKADLSGFSDDSFDFEDMEF
jgi:ribonucleotide reductase beta subunit family protein with ferritin-like domain